jgi:polyisoprenoid-binding protein YceI
MKTILTLLLLCTSVLGMSQINTKDSKISFTFESKDVTGSIGGIQSQSEIDLSQLENSKIKGSVSVSSLETGNFLRDGHLMWEKYFNRSDYPRIYFESTAITAKGNASYTILGNLNIKGISKPVTFTAVKTGGLIKISGTIYTSDWDITIDKERKNNKLTIVMDLQLKGI